MKILETLRGNFTWSVCCGWFSGYAGCLSMVFCFALSEPFQYLTHLTVCFASSWASNPHEARAEVFRVRCQIAKDRQRPSSEHHHKVHKHAQQIVHWCKVCSRISTAEDPVGRLSLSLSLDTLVITGKKWTSETARSSQTVLFWPWPIEEMTSITAPSYPKLLTRVNKAGMLPTANPMQMPSNLLMLTSKEDPEVWEKIREVATTHPQL